MTTGENMRQVRNRAGLSREKLSEASGVRVMTIRNLETDRCSPYLYTVICLADALKIPIDEYIGRKV